jgi:hypothetical protein
LIQIKVADFRRGNLSHSPAINPRAAMPHLGRCAPISPTPAFVTDLDRMIAFYTKVLG